MIPTTTSLSTSLRRQHLMIDASIVLTPVDSFPIYDVNAIDSARIEGLYATDRLRSPDEIMASKIFISGRNRLSSDMNRIYCAWSTALGAAETSMRVLSGLHAHVTVFMGLGQIGSTVMLLPEHAGGHIATAGILRRLGYNIVDIPIDTAGRRVDRKRFAQTFAQTNPDIIFIDRSEGLIYEDFSGLFDGLDVYAVFDASQYLPGILTGHYKSPFEMGFHLLISTLHKSFPGPQKALVATREADDGWMRVKAALSGFVSSVHVRSTYLAGFALAAGDRLRTYSSRLLENAVALEAALADRGVPVERRGENGPPTQHVWVRLNSARDAYHLFRELERCRIHANYRLLPYGLGYGLRLGTTGATLQGLRPSHAAPLAAIIGDVFDHGFALSRRHAVRELAERMGSCNDLFDRVTDENHGFRYDGSGSLLREWETGDWSRTPPPPSVHSSEYRAFLVALMRSLPVAEDASLISLGCGNGFVEADLSDAGFNVLATDRAAEALALAIAKGLAARRVDALAPPENLGRFDIVYADGLAGHLLLEPQGLAEFGATLRRLVTESGFVVLSNDLSDTDSPMTTVRGRPNAVFFRGPAGEIARLLLPHLSGFRLERTEWFEFKRPGRGRRVREIAILRRERGGNRATIFTDGREESTSRFAQGPEPTAS